MWSCAKQCGYWDGSGCGIDYNPASLLLRCPCFDLAITHARDPTPFAGQRSEPADRAGKRSSKSKSKEKVP